MRYLLIVQLKDFPSEDRVGGDVREIVGIVSRFSGGEHEVAFRSKCGLVFGFFFKSNQHVFAMQGAISTSTGFRNGDGMIACEVGELMAGVGLSRAFAWLQHNK